MEVASHGNVAGIRIRNEDSDVQKQPDSQSSTTAAASTTQSLENVLGLRCLALVLSYLTECEGTALLLTRKQYWTDTILQLLEVPPPAEKPKLKSLSKPTTTDAENEENPTTTKQKQQQLQKRHQFWGKKRSPVIKIPDAKTRLDRLNTRRWYTRQQRRKVDEKITKDGEIISLSNLNSKMLAETEWRETVEGDFGNSEVVQSCQCIMSLPLLRFYDTACSHDQQKVPLFKHGTTCLASYPRSGNTLLRSLLETITGFVTSSDTRPDRNLSVALAEKPPYFVGEGLAPPKLNPSSASSSSSSSPPPNRKSHYSPLAKSPFLPPQGSGGILSPPPICKTHWPERIGCHSYNCHRVILLVRNPFDAADSYWHMNLTNTHTQKVKPHVTQEHKAFYDQLVRHEILQVWISFLDYYWKECSKMHIPLLLVRYEDLVLDRKRELQRILQFCCNNGCDNENDQAWWKQRLEEVTREGNSKANNGDSSEKNRKSDIGYRSTSSMADDTEEITKAAHLPNATKEHSVTGSNTSSSSTRIETTEKATKSEQEKTNKNNHPKSSHPSIGRSLRKGMLPESLLRAIHNFDEQPLLPKRHGNTTTGWLERLGYHVYKQGFPNNLDRLPPVPVLELPQPKSNSENSLTINVQDAAIELRPRDSPYGRKMREWRRERTKNDTKPFPTI